MTKTNYNLIRSKRKTLSLIIERDAGLTVRAPLRMPVREIEAFIAEKADWIAAKQLEMKKRGDRYRRLVIETGEKLPYFGEQYIVFKCDTPKIKAEDGKILVKRDTSPEDIADWLKDESKTFIKERVELYADIMNVKYSAVKISGAKTRWGSCSAKNSLNFSWRLAMCPPEVIDYVVIHELSHVIYKNHGRDFWSMVEKYKPDYRLCRKWLRDNGRIMDIL